MEEILIIEDDLDLQEGLKYTLEMDGYKVEAAGTEKEGLEAVKMHSFDILILDCNLPDGSGFELCTLIRQFSDVPIIMLTARDTEMDEVNALQLGVDDYMSKPFSIAVLKVRIKKLLARQKEPERIESNGICIDKRICKVYKKGEELDCTKLEYRMLIYFLENKNQVLSKEQILDHIWDQEGKYVDENTVSVNVRRLRTKIEDDPAVPAFIKTVHGIGYIWKEKML
ncbi:response regulator transcription factor [Clostridium oryzae]|uniref:Stage 0 sporulation protein A homolog n=1 Tax=Clostridium oryzae TaxID=1450648 RepID=A0A1V4INS1_9CLOT|nr:response regulator transcription factor [Clostridium oryzae]OPJ61440.1 response regulator ArlR [Clostridium oryzae]